ncbi:MAG: hypothetical protein U0360_05225 [Dehalococcoidia bacterium]
MIQTYAGYAGPRPLGTGAGAAGRLFSVRVRWGAVAVLAVVMPIAAIAAALASPVPRVAPVAIEPPPAIEVALAAPPSSDVPVAETPGYAPSDSASFFAPHPAFDLSQVDLYFDPECICLGWY